METLEYPQVIKQTYVFEKFIGKGSFGAVCLYKNRRENNKRFAIKLEDINSAMSTITSEALIMKKLAPNNVYDFNNNSEENSNFFPKYYEHGLSD